MNKKCLSFSHFADAADAAVEAVAARKVDLKTRHILLVPDKYTLYFEERLFSGGGAFDLEVLTLNRLFSKTVTTSADYLSKQGAVMLVRGILENADLQCFGRSARYKGFAEKMYETICQLSAAGTDVATARISGALEKKIADIAFVAETYAAMTAGKYCDASGRFRLLAENLDAPYVRDAYFYVVNFNGMTAQQTRIIDRLAAVSRGVTEFICTPKRGKKAGVRLYRASDEVSELKYAARTVRGLVYAGAKYGDINIAYGGDLRQLKRIFDEYEIPFFADDTVKLSAHPLPRFLLDAIDCIERGYRRADMIALSKNVYAGATKRDADAFENDVNARLVDYKGFFRPFEDERSERVRAALTEKLSVLEHALKSKDNAAFFKAAKKLIEIARPAAAPAVKAFAAADSKAETDNTADLTDDAAAEKTLAVLDMTEKLMRGCKLQTVVESIAEGINATDLRAIPSYTDTVTVGVPAVFRARRSRYLLVLGASDGDMPMRVGDNGIISDREADELKKQGIAADPKTSELNARAADELREIVLSADSVYLSYTADKRLSCVLSAMLDEKSLTTSSDEDVYNEMLFGGVAAIQATKAYCTAKAAATELFATGIGKLPCAPSVGAALPESEQYIKPIECFPSRIERAKYMERTKLGVSEIESYFRCPLLHFFRYGLKLKPRDTGELSSLDVGTFLHAVVDRFVGDTSGLPVETVVGGIVDALAREESKFRLEENAALLERIKAEAITVCGVVAAQRKAGAFTPLYREATFGTGGDLAPIVLHTSTGDVELTGKIDRIDVTDDFVRVIDYKTGNTSFSFGDTYYGLKLQLPLYGLTAVRSTGKTPAGLFYFPFKVRWSNEACNLLDGPFNSCDAALQAIDRAFTEDGKVTSSVIKAKATVTDGAVKVDARNRNAIDEAMFERLFRYAEEAATYAVDEMRDGAVRPAPMQTGRFVPCETCDYNACCRNVKTRKGDATGAGAVIKAISE